MNQRSLKNLGVFVCYTDFTKNPRNKLAEETTHTGWRGGTVVTNMAAHPGDLRATPSTHMEGHN